MKKFLIIIAFVVVILLGFFYGTGKGNKSKLSFSRFVEGISPEKEVPLHDQKMFTVVIYAHNASHWCERVLSSVFEQDYERFRVVFIDDASTDGTFQKAQQFIVQNQQDYRVIAIRNDHTIGFVGSLYRSADYCQNREIIIPINAQNWLATDSVLTRLNHVFQNPDVWMTFSSSIEYPSYNKISVTGLNRASIEKFGYSQFENMEPPIAFYADLFKSIHLSDFLIEGQFAKSPEAYIIKLLEHSGGRYRCLEDILIIKNQSISIRDPITSQKEKNTFQSRNVDPPLLHFPENSSSAKKGIALVLFSFDRPIQLLGALESTTRYIKGVETISVLYRASDQRFETAYSNIKVLYPNVHFVPQSDTPHKDFKPLLLQTIEDSSSEYILFGSDDMIVKDFVDLLFCQEMLEKTGAYGFYLRLGSNIQNAHSQNHLESIPPSIALNNGVFAWDFRDGNSDWATYHSIDMVLYRKSDVISVLTDLKFKTPNSLEKIWAKQPFLNPVGLYFDHSKTMNLPLNISRGSNSIHLNLTAEELLVKFNQGLKMDIHPFFQVENNAFQYEGIPDFIPR